MNTTALNNAIHRLRHDIYLDDQQGLDARRADIELVSHELGLAENTIDRLVGDLAKEANGPTFMGEPVLPHDDAVDRFAASMKQKLAAARAKGRGGWNNNEPGMHQRLSDMLRAHVEKGDPLDVANFCMFLHQRGEAITASRAPTTANAPRTSMQFTLGQAETLLSFFGGSNGDMTVEYFPANHWPDNPTAPAGLYVYCTEYPEEGAQWLGAEDNSEAIEPTWQHIPPDRAAPPAAVLDHAVHAYKVACVSRMAMETHPEGNPSVEVLDASIREGVRAVLLSMQALGPATAVDAILPAVMAEIETATAKFPTWPTDPLHAIGVLGEEFGELTKAVMQATYEPHKSTTGDVRTEAIQTAAMALRFVASLDHYAFAGSAQHRQRASEAI